MKKVSSFLALFTSFSTLLCCALPALMVSLGLGAAMAGFLTKFPQLIWLSEHKLWLFIVGGFLLFANGLVLFRAPKECPVDLSTDIREACEDSKSWSKPLWGISVAIYLIGFSFAYVLPYVLA